VPEGEISGALSNNGIEWTRDQHATLTFDAEIEGSEFNKVPQVLKPYIYWPDVDKYIMFYNSHSRVFIAESEDALSWKKLGFIGTRDADVDAIILPDGNIRIYYGDYNPESPGVVYTGIISAKDYRQFANN